MLSRLLMLASFIIVLSSVAEEPATGGSPTAPTEKSAAETAWADLRWLTTALEAYASDNDWLYAPADGRRDGAVSELDGLLEWYHANTYPKRSAPPRVDPWGQPYRFVVSNARKQYAVYSSGPNAKLGDAEDAFLARLKKDRLSEDDMKERHVSHNLVVASGVLVFAPAEIHRLIQPKE